MHNLINKIHNCDNREIIKKIPDKSVQVFLEDMPYGTTACKWDKVPDLQEYWNLRLNKIADNGCFVLFGSEPFSSYLRMSNIKEFKYDWVWEKNLGGGFALCKKQPLKRHEIISIFYKSQCKYFPIMREYSESTKKRFKQGEFVNRNTNKITNVINNGINYKGLTPIDFNKGAYPISILEYKRPHIANGNSLHPTQKPVALFEYLIKTYTNENDLIFDGFSGSGTTAIASYKNNRNFICCELDKNYYEKSINRLKEETSKINLF